MEGLASPRHGSKHKLEQSPQIEYIQSIIDKIQKFQGTGGATTLCQALQYAAKAFVAPDDSPVTESLKRVFVLSDFSLPAEDLMPPEREGQGVSGSFCDEAHEHLAPEQLANPYKVETIFQALSHAACSTTNGLKTGDDIATAAHKEGLWTGTTGSLPER